MPAFLHDRLRVLGEVLGMLNDAVRSYNDMKPSLGADLERCLDVAIETYRRLGLSDVENELLSLKAQHVAAGRGVNPITLERVSTHRREMGRAAALRVLEQAGQRLRADVNRDRRVLEQAKEQLVPVTLHALRKGIVAEMNGVPPTQAELEHSWKAVLADDELQLAARQIAMQILAADVILLLADLIAAIRPVPT